MPEVRPGLGDPTGDALDNKRPDEADNGHQGGDGCTCKAWGRNGWPHGSGIQLRDIRLISQGFSCSVLPDSTILTATNEKSELLSWELSLSKETFVPT